MQPSQRVCIPPLARRYLLRCRNSSKRCISAAFTIQPSCSIGLLSLGFLTTVKYHLIPFSQCMRLQQCMLLITGRLDSTLIISSFLTPSSKVLQENLDLIRPLGDMRSLGRQWAIHAGKQVLQDIDQPTFESVGTTQMLAIYWFHAGEWQRNTMFSGIAYKAACTVGLDLSNKTSFYEPEFNPGTEGTTEWLEIETKRRCFWAVWFTQCVNADHRFMGGSYDGSVIGLPLPIAETSFERMVREPLLTLSTILHRPQQREIQMSGTPSIMAELMFLMWNWAKIRDLVRTTDRMAVKDWLAELFSLDGSLSTWITRLPDCFRYSKRTLYEQLVVNHQPVYVFVYALYHQCKLVLHSSLVPQFSGVRLYETPPTEAANLSARIALKSAQSLSELGSDLLALDWDPAQIPAFVGYCMYVSAWINITLLSSTDTAIAALAQKNLIYNLKLLKSMKPYWANLERLWTRINMLYNAQTGGQHRPSSIHPAITGSTTDPQSPSSNGLDEQFAAAGGGGRPRETGQQLSEPLADSVMQYTLRRLRPGSNVFPSTLRDIEATAEAEALDALLLGDKVKNNPTHVMADNSRGPPDHSQPPLPTTLDGNNTTAGLAAARGSETEMRSPIIPDLQGSNFDSWHPNLDNIQPPPGPYNDIFDLDFST
ncbi:hypothetical protein, variant [Exophiala oligosperma]|uniref:Transcription factor domain-containing protein n=1 Tax=Exophiala oligosperma TaxID=215243 RepID=A0A0D2DKD7_9EURO|nr:hypothetical protein, variant [Exophiala oligosperma]KIW43418.1 hypothetical protein, variant [Exophiala oligosperma]